MSKLRSPVVVLVATLLFAGCGNDASHSSNGGGRTNTPSPPANGSAPAAGPAPTAPGVNEEDPPRRTLPDPAAGGGEAPAPPRIPPSPTGDPLGDRMHALLGDLAEGRLTNADRVKVEDRVAAALADLSLGSPDGRIDVARMIAGQILDQMAAVGGPSTVSGQAAALRAQALKIKANELAGDLYRRLPKDGKVHTGALSVSKDVPVPPGYVAAPWAVLGGFEYVEGRALPAASLALNGKKVGAVGYMMTLEEVEDIHEFLLVESIWSCCFGKPPEVHQVIVVTIPGKRGVELTTVPVQVLGSFEVGEEKEDGFVISVYRLKAEKVVEVP